VIPLLKKRDPWAAPCKLLFLFFIPLFKRPNKVFEVIVHKHQIRVTLVA